MALAAIAFGMAALARVVALETALQRFRDQGGCGPCVMWPHSLIIFADYEYGAACDSIGRAS